MASDLRGYTEQETLNKVLNTDNDSIQVDIVDATGVTITATDASVYVDDADWTDSTSSHTLVGGLYQSTPQTITDGDTGPLQVNANGNLIVDLSATDNAVLDAMVVDLAAMETLLTAANVDHAANEVLLTGIDADTDAIKTDMAAIEVLLTAANVDHAANEVLLGTIDSDTNDIKTATESSNTHLGNMFYDTVVSVTPHDTNPISAGPVTYYALWVGTGGNVKVTLAGSGTQTFNNVASGQLLPIVVTHVFSTNTTALNILALK